VLGKVSIGARQKVRRNDATARVRPSRPQEGRKEKPVSGDAASAPLVWAELRRQIEQNLDAKTTLFVGTGGSWLNGIEAGYPRALSRKSAK
jgi:hypothetical protein